MKPSILSKQKATYAIRHLKDFKGRALQWAKQFEKIAFFDNNKHQTNAYQSHECLLAAGAQSEIKITSSSGDSFLQLRHFYDQTPDWLFGFLTYDLKNELEDLSSVHQDGLGFPLLHFFQATYLLQIGEGEVSIESWGKDPEIVFKEIEKTEPLRANAAQQQSIKVKAKIAKADYLERVEKIRQHIIEGDVYELNFCQEFFAEAATFDPWEAFVRLNEISKAPFSGFYRCEDQYVLCASPERFIKKEGNKIISQPIKGTIGRSADTQEDQALQNTLYHSTKDRAENVMIVDLVRNDLARTCQPGSVKVEELFGIYPFAQVYQMISTVVGEKRPEIHPIEVISKAFPMGSMTGAPKVMSMQLIEAYEESRRGVYAGAIGYFSPAGDFDFNVVIRSLLYNEAKKYLSFQVGGAIVYDSEPEKEYEECLLKAKGMMEVLGWNG